MTESRTSYHSRRAADERARADRTEDMAIARVHRELASLHEERVRGARLVNCGR